jgi:hypothetical protein
MSETTPRLALPELVAAQSQKHVTVNEALVNLDCLTDCYLTSMALTAPPSSPSDGDAYLVATGGTGDWSGYDGKIAYCIDSAWRFYAPFKGLRAYNAADSKFYVYTGSSWADWSTALSLAGSVLASGRILVGGASGAAAAVTMSGDATINNTGAVTVSKIGGKTAVMPAAGTIVDLESTQTLTNKTLTAPAISGGTINGTSIGATTKSTGAFTTLATTGAATLGSTLAVSGAATFSSSLTAASLTTAGTVSGAVATISGNATVGGTLGVTGAVTLVGGTINGTSIGATTPSTGAFTTLDVNGTINGTTLRIGGYTASWGGTFAMSGAYSFTGTLTGNTAVTFPASGTLMNLESAQTVTGAKTFTNGMNFGSSAGMCIWSISGDNAGMQLMGTSGATPITSLFCYPYLSMALGRSGFPWSNVFATILTPSTGITRIADGSSATSGYVGYTTSASVASASAVSLVTGTTATVTSVGVPSGDFWVRGHLNFNTSAATLEAGAKLAFGVGTTSATLTDNQYNIHRSPGVSGNTETPYFSGDTPWLHVVGSTSTTVYLVAQAAFTAGMVSAWGKIEIVNNAR